MNPIVLSINPTYLCNFRCDFCYLTPAQLADPTKIDLAQLSSMLEHVTTYVPIKHVDLYGGEISALPPEYQLQLLDVIERYHTGRINVVTNLLRISPLLSMQNVDVSVSYDFDQRERHEVVWANITSFTRPIHILILATSGVMSKDVDAMIRQLNTVPSIVSVEIKPYSTNQANHHRMVYTEFEQFVRRWIESPVAKHFTLTNEHEIQRAATGSRNAFSDDHLYITPLGKFAVLDFDLNQREYFHEIENFDQYIDWTMKEKNQAFSNSFCNRCEFLGHCLTEHLRPVLDVTNSCNGYYNLITWYKNERMES